MSSSSAAGWEEASRSKLVEMVVGPVFRRFEGGARWSSVWVMSTLGREEGTAVERCSSASLSTDGGSERSEEAGDEAMVSGQPRERSCGQWTEMELALRLKTGGAVAAESHFRRFADAWKEKLQLHSFTLTILTIYLTARIHIPSRELVMGYTMMLLQRESASLTLGEQSGAS